MGIFPVMTVQRLAKMRLILHSTKRGNGDTEATKRAFSLQTVGPETNARRSEQIPRMPPRRKAHLRNTKERSMQSNLNHHLS